MYEYKIEKRSYNWWFIVYGFIVWKEDSDKGVCVLFYKVVKLFLFLGFYG